MDGRVRRIERRLNETYGRAVKPTLDPLDELILTILSQSTTDTNRDRAWANLKGDFADWETVQMASPQRLEASIRVAGLARQKTAAIRGVLSRLSREVGRPSLSHLSTMEDREALSYLSSFDGVGVKTAACVLCFSLGRAVLPVDTHVLRVSQRLGLVPARATAAAAHRELNLQVPPELRFSLHVHLIHHGRATCRARRPKCGRCELVDLCPKVGLGNGESGVAVPTGGSDRPV